MYCKPIDRIRFTITPLEGGQPLEATVFLEDLGFTPIPGDVFTSYKWFHRAMKLQVVERNFEADYGELRLRCIELDPEIVKTNTHAAEEEEPSKRRVKEEEPTKLAPFLSTDGTGAEKMTAENYRKFNKARSGYTGET
jgi:hypothetical protein